jgi:hypothetical protein
VAPETLIALVVLRLEHQLGGFFAADENGGKLSIDISRALTAINIPIKEKKYREERGNKEKEKGECERVVYFVCESVS